MTENAMNNRPLKEQLKLWSIAFGCAMAIHLIFSVTEAIKHPVAVWTAFGIICLYYFSLYVVLIRGTSNVFFQSNSNSVAYNLTLGAGIGLMMAILPKIDLWHVASVVFLPGILAFSLNPKCQKALPQPNDEKRNRRNAIMFVICFVVFNGTGIALAKYGEMPLPLAFSVGLAFGYLAKEILKTAHRVSPETGGDVLLSRILVVLSLCAPFGSIWAWDKPHFYFAVIKIEIVALFIAAAIFAVNKEVRNNPRNRSFELK